MAQGAGKMSSGTEKVSAIALADSFFDWYRRHARSARVAAHSIEFALLLAGALVPLSVIASDSELWPALLGAVIVVLTGMRRVYHHDVNWRRFTDACVEIETARRFYVQQIEPYDDPARRDERLIRRIREIESQETASWSEIRAAAQKTTP
jgi:hypothetical protein